MLHFDISAKPVDVTIIGMGGAGTSAFIQLVDEIERATSTHPESRKQISIQLFERSNIAGPGFPYHPESQSNALWTLNNPNSLMSLFHPESGKMNDFCDWLEMNKQACIDKYQDAVLTDNLERSKYAPRKIFGEYCHSRFEEYKHKAKLMGIKVNLDVETEVMHADITSNGEWLLHAKSAKYGLKKIFSKNILVTTGHLPSTAKPASELTNSYDAYSHFEIDTNKSVMVLGTGLTAIDTVKALLHRNHQGMIYMISPSGTLPKIKPDYSLGAYTFKYLTKENLCIENLELKTILSLFCMELGLNAEYPEKKLKNILEHNGTSPETLFRDELDDVLAKTRNWQVILGNIWYEVLFMIAHHIRDEDRSVFFKEYFSHFMKWAAGMTLENAKILDVVMGKQLRLIKIGKQETLENGVFTVTTANGEIIKADIKVNGFGAGYDIDKSTLLANMKKQGLLTSPDCVGGIKIDHNFHIIKSADGSVHHHAWAVGVVTFGCNPSANSIICAAINAKKVVLEVVAKLVNNLDLSMQQKIAM